MLPTSQSELAFVEHWNLVAESSSIPLDAEQRASNRAHFSNSKYAKKRDILSEKRESGMVQKKCEFTPGSGNVDTYDICTLYTARCLKTAILSNWDIGSLSYSAVGMNLVIAIL